MNKLSITFLLLFIESSIFASGTDRTNELGLQLFRQIDVENIWSQSGNAAGLSQMPELFPSEIKLNFGDSSGDFHSVFKGKSKQDYGLSSRSYLKINKTFLYGSFGYNRSFEKGLNYSNTNDPAQNYPYLLADTIGNDKYDREFFVASGTLASPLNHKIYWGLGFDYQVGIAAQDRDPRAENKVMKLSISPGMVFKTDRFNIGASVVYGYYNEDIDVSVVRKGVQQTMFQMVGPGVFRYHSSTSFFRLYQQQSVGGGLQLELKKNAFSNLLYSNYLYYQQTIDDGRGGSVATWAAVKNDSKIDGIRWNINDVLFFQRGNRIQQLKATFGLSNKLGTEFIQQLERVGQVDMERWVTYASIQKYYSLETTGLLSYLQMKKDENNCIKSLFSASVDYHSFAEKYYFPNLKTNYSNLNFKSSFLKLFQVEKAAISAEIRLECQLNTDKSQNLDQENFMVQKIYQPEFIYLTRDYFSPGMTVGYQIPLKNIPARWFINSNFDWFYSSGSRYMTVFNFSTGLLF